MGVGDDAALIQPSTSTALVTAMDTLVEGRHFPKDFPSQWLASRALGVNLSDIAAMGAIPRWLTLSLCMPTGDEAWVKPFADEFLRLCEQYQVQLVGGDTVAGPLTVTINVIGQVDGTKALRRSGAKHDDEIYVTGYLGEAAAAVSLLLQSKNYEHHPSFVRYRSPQPRLQQGQDLVGLASAAIDVSDGLIADLTHVCVASGVGAEIDLGRLPVSETLLNWVGRHKALEFAGSGGDDYELCFTLPKEHRGELENLAKQWAIPVTRIGQVTKGETVKCYLDGSQVYPAHCGYDHFATEGE